MSATQDLHQKWSFQSWVFRFKGINPAKANTEMRRRLQLKEAAFKTDTKELQEKLLQALYQHNAFYRSKLPAGIVSWESLPILEKSDFQGNQHHLISSNFSKKDVYLSSTSGSSGQPFHFSKSKSSHALAWAINGYLYTQHGISESDLQARFYGIPKEPLGYFTEKLKDFLLNRQRFPVFDLSDMALMEFTRQFSKNKFIYLYGYANSLVLFANFLVHEKIVLREICPTLKCCITTSEMCSDEDRALMQQAFGIKIINEYGSSETGIMAFEDRDGDWVLNTLNQYFEVVDDDGNVLPNGEEGNILVTDLYNEAFPFIRYKIGDRGIITLKEKNGRQIHVLKSLTGRINDTIVLPSGKKAAGLTFYYISRGILNASGVIKEFIIRQKALDTFLFEVVCDEPLTQNQIQDIEHKLIDYLEPGIKLEIKRVAAIERPLNGKRKHFISEL